MTLQRLLVVAIAIATLATSLAANELKVSSSRIHLDESLHLTIELTGSFAENDDVPLKLDNLEVVSGPRISNEFSWINGVSRRRRSFSYTLRPGATGTATIGPIAIVDADRRRDTLGPVHVEVLAEATASLGGDPIALLRYYASASRPRVAVAVELDQRTARVGEQIVATWYVYTAESIDTLSVTSAPAMSDFWTEEISVNRRDDTELFVDGMPVRKVPVRRAALFPLRSGRLEIPPLEVAAEVMQAIGDPFDRFGMLNSRSVTQRRRASGTTVDATPAPLAQVGNYSMRCTNAKVSPVGLVSIDVTVTGNGNLRAAEPPKFTASPAAEVQILPGELKVERKEDGVSMQRSWRFLLFPKNRGLLSIPPLSFEYFDPSPGVSRAIHCSFVPVTVERIERSVAAERSESAESSPARWPRALLATLLLVAVGGAAMFFVARRRRRRALERRADEILSADSPLELRRRFDAFLAASNTTRTALMAESSERGELARSVSSLIEYRIVQPAHASEIDDELRERLIELVAILEPSGAMTENR